MTKQLTPLRRKDIETGRKLEREAIVKWLRSYPADPHELERDNMFADGIENGEHLK